MKFPNYDFSWLFFFFLYLASLYYIYEWRNFDHSAVEKDISRICLFSLSLRQSCKRNLVLKKNKLVSNSLTVCFLNLDQNNDLKDQTTSVGWLTNPDGCLWPLQSRVAKFQIQTFMYYSASTFWWNNVVFFQQHSYNYLKDTGLW